MNHRRLIGGLAAASLFVVAAFVVSRRPPPTRVEPPAPPPIAERAPSARVEIVPAAVAQPVSEPGAFESDTARALAEEGWTIVDEPPPDPAVVDFDPSLLRGREDELRVQLASAAPRERHVPNLAAIARRATDPTTRALAIDALGRVDAPDAQRALLELLGALDRDDPARASVAAQLRPSSSDDPFAGELARRVGDASLDRSIRESLAFTLALVAERDGVEGAAPFERELSADGAELFARMRALARGEIGPKRTQPRTP